MCRMHPKLRSRTACRTARVSQPPHSNHQRATIPSPRPADSASLLGALTHVYLSCRQHLVQGHAGKTGMRRHRWGHERPATEHGIRQKSRRRQFAPPHAPKQPEVLRVRSTGPTPGTRRRVAPPGTCRGRACVTDCQARAPSEATARRAAQDTHDAQTS